MSKKPYDICVTRKYENKEGEEKTKWTNVGVAFELEKGGMSCETEDGVALTGKFVILPRKPKDAN